MDFLYEARSDDVSLFGEHWCGPDRFEPHEWTKVARYEAEKGGDGQHAEVWCMAMPARFYSVRVFAHPNSCDEPQPDWPFCLTTGSGREMAVLCIQIAENVANGMLGMTMMKEVK
jgi:hypothetical protein